MNINSNEILLFNKKNRMGERAAFNEVNIPETASDETQALAPQKAMNALMFKGLNNVVTNPALASSLNLMNEEGAEIAEDDSAKEYVAPFKSNIAFQGVKANKFKQFAVAALLGLGTLASTTSCKEDKEIETIPPQVTQTVTVSVDFSAVTEMFSQMQVMWLQMLEQQRITNEQLAANNAFMQQMMALMQQQGTDAKDFYNKMASWMVETTTNQEVMIQIMVQNGKTQEEANKMIADLKKLVEAGKFDQVATMIQQILGLVGDIKALLEGAISDFKVYFEEYKKMIQNQTNVIEQGFTDLKIKGDIDHQLMETLIKQGEEIKDIGNKQIAASNNIKTAIERANVDSNANFEALIEKLGINQRELITTLEKLGYSEGEILKMTAGQILAAIEENTKATEGVGKLVSTVVNQLRILPKLLKENKITNAELRTFADAMSTKLDSLISEAQTANMNAEQFYQEAINLMLGSQEKQNVIIAILAENGMKQDEANALISKLIREVKSGNKTAEAAYNELANLLGDIKGMLSEILTTFTTYLDQVLAKQDELKKTVKNAANQINSTQMMQVGMTSVLIQQNEELKALSEKEIQAANEVRDAVVKANLDSNANFETVVKTLGTNQEELISTLKKLGYSEAQILQMTAGQIIGAINNNTAVVQGTNNLMTFVIGQLSILPQMLQEQRITNAQMREFNNAMVQKLDKLTEEVKNGNITAEQFYAEALSLISESNNNQEVIIAQLVANGRTEAEARNLLNSILREVKSGNKTAAAAYDAITKLLGDIKGALSEILTTFSSYFDQMLAKQDELKSTVKTGINQLNTTGMIQTGMMSVIIKQNEDLKSLSEKEIQAANEIKDAVVKANLDSNANFETVIARLGINQQELISTLKKMGYQEAQILNMTAQQLINAINKNTAVVSGTNHLLTFVIGELSVLPQLLKEQKITNAQLREFNNAMSAKLDKLTEEVKNGNMTAEQFYKEALGLISESNNNQEVIIAQLVANGRTEADARNLLKKLINEVKSGNKTAEAAYKEITSLLQEINSNLSTLLTEFQSFVSQYKQDKKAEFGLLGQLVMDNKFQTGILLDMSSTQKRMANDLSKVKNNTNELLEIAKDDTKYQELIGLIKEAMKDKNSIDYKRFEEMFKLLNMNLTNVITMSSSQMQSAINSFKNTYIKNEEKQTEYLASINTKLDCIKYLNGANKNEIVGAINNLTKAVNNNTQAVEDGTLDVTNELKAIKTAIDKLQATVNAILKTMGQAAANADMYFQKWNTKFNLALGSLKNIENGIAGIKANQATAEAYLKNLYNEVQKLKAELKNIQVQGGEGFDYGKLEEMWQQHDADNFEKYSSLIKGLNINPSDSSNIEALLKSIDSKMKYIQDNSDILNKILNKLNGIDFSNPNYNAKLDKIIELLENFKCNCQCGGNNEGILGDLDNILG